MKEQFLETLRLLGNRATNKHILNILKGAVPSWDEVAYRNIKAELLAEGKIKLGRGRGGTVSIV